MRILLAAAILGCGLTGACGVIDPAPTEFMIKADSIVGPNAVSGGASFTQTIYGYVGPSGCFRFKEFRMSQTQHLVDVTIIGYRNDGPDVVCTASLEFMQQTLTVSPPMSNPLTISIRQPDGTVLTKTISIE